MNCSSSRLTGLRTISSARSPGVYDVAAKVAVNGGGDHLLAGAAALVETTITKSATQPAAETHPRDETRIRYGTIGASVGSDGTSGSNGSNAPGTGGGGAGSAVGSSDGGASGTGGGGAVSVNGRLERTTAVPALPVANVRTVYW